MIVNPVVNPVHPWDRSKRAPPLPPTGENQNRINLNQPPPPPPPSAPPTAGPMGHAGGEVLMDFSGGAGLQAPPPPPPAQPAGARRDPRTLARQRSTPADPRPPPAPPANVVPPLPPPDFQPLEELPRAPRPAPVSLPGLGTAKPPPLPSVTGLGIEADDASVTAMAGMETAVLPPPVNLARDTRAPPPRRRSSAVSPTTAERPPLNRQPSKQGGTTPTRVVFPGASPRSDDASVSPRSQAGRSPSSAGSRTPREDREDPLIRDQHYKQRRKEMKEKHEKLCEIYKNDPTPENQRKRDEEKWQLDIQMLDIEINQILINQKLHGHSLLVGHPNVYYSKYVLILCSGFWVCQALS